MTNIERLGIHMTNIEHFSRKYVESHDKHSYGTSLRIKKYGITSNLMIAQVLKWESLCVQTFTDRKYCGDQFYGRV